jgi:RNA polymerase sigma-54 factor
MFQSLSIRTELKIGPRLVLAGKLLRAPGDEIEQMINRELANNPALELVPERRLRDENSRQEHLACTRRLGSDRFSSMVAGYGQTFDEIEEHFAQRRSPLERLVDQASVLTNTSDWGLVVSLIYCLDHRGFLVDPADQLASKLGVPQESVERAIKVLQRLDPPGIAARDIRECFLLQCAHLEAEGRDCHPVRQILTLAWDDFLHQQWLRVARKIGETKQVIQKAVVFMRANLYPYPLSIGEGSSINEDTLRVVDLIFQEENQSNSPTYSIRIPGAEIFELRVCTKVQEAFQSSTTPSAGLSGHERCWLRDQVDRAQIVVDALSQRWGTLHRIGEYLLRTQKDFITHGPLYLKPITQAALAKELGLHESTVSRAVKDKNVQMPDGHLVPLQAFFDPTLAAKEAIRILQNRANEPMSDREIAERLESKGLRLARRTVAKYRLEMSQ